MPFRISAALLAAAVAAPALAQSGNVDLAESENFRLVCPDPDRCGADAAPDVAAAAPRLLDLMEDARAWLDGLGFPVAESHLDPRRSDVRALVVDPEPPGQGRCGDNAVACHRSNMINESLIHLPQANLHRFDDAPDTLAHEYVHTLQPDRDPGELHWMNEAVATAIGTVFGVRHGGSTGIYEPIYLMSLDRPFHDVVDAGYGNWAYLLEVGRILQSPNNVAYLAQDGFLKITRLRSGAPAVAGMEPLYDSALVGAATFDAVFPDFVARFNNIEASVAPGESAYHYYTDIARHRVEIDFTALAFPRDFEGEAANFAAAPMLLELDVRPPPDADPKDTLLMTEIELVAGAPLDDLTLVVEHRTADAQHLQKYMLDGSDPPEEPGFVRVVNAPASAAAGTGTNPFRLRVAARPIGIAPPACFQAGHPTRMEPEGFSPDEADNWRLRTDNGSVDGLTVTPAHAGPMTISLEIDSPVTRGEGTLAPVEPARSEVELGQFDVVAEDCMVRLIAGGAELTYSADGAYTEFRVPSGEAIYFSDSDIAAWESGRWLPIPPMAKAMMMQNMGRMSPAMGALMSGAGGDSETFAARMPLELSRRFAWGNLRNTRGPDGGPPRRSRAACPRGGSGCTETTFLMDGNPVPVVFDSQDRPVSVSFMGHAMEFAYGSWDIRRPPGW